MLDENCMFFYQDASFPQTRVTLLKWLLQHPSISAKAIAGESQQHYMRILQRSELMNITLSLQLNFYGVLYF